MVHPPLADHLVDAARAPLTQLANRDLRSLLLIRHFELALLDAFSKGKVNGTTHACLGQEYIAVALSTLLRSEDFFFSNHRGHGHYLARFDDPEGLLAELMGREGAVCQGVGGSQHLYRDDCYLSTGVQGESLPVALGVALHFKRRNNHALAVVAIGDGTWGQGSVYEALNIAQLWRLPVVVVVENNGIAQTTPTSLHMAGSIAGRARAFEIRHLPVSSIDVNTIRTVLSEPIEAVRRTCLPLVIEFDTVRLGPHSKGDDTRDPAQLEALRKRDWYTNYQQQFPQQFREILCPTLERLEKIFVDVEHRPLASWTP